MRRRTGYAAATALALMLAIPLPGIATPAAAAERNIAREQVAQWERKMLERFLSPEAAARLKPAPRIIGGDLAPPGAWPFQAGLLVASIANNANAQYCGASVIHEFFILTAAHCLDIGFITGPDSIEVLTNTQSLASGGVRHEVATFRIHPRWDPNTSDYDIAVIKLKRRVKGIRPAKFADFITSVAEETASAPPQENARTIGWGDTDPGAGQSFPTELRQVQVPIVARNVCNGPSSYDGAITPRMLCAGLKAGGKDSCQGDSGGPLLVRNAGNKFRLQVGVVSWGIGCALPDFYGVYARLAVLGPWVQKTIDKLSD